MVVSAPAASTTAPTATTSAPTADRRGEILEAALEVFTKRGYHRATIEEIRAASGASTGSIYHHFRGKEELAADLYVEGLRHYQRSFLDALRGGGGAESTVRAIVVNHLRWVQGNRDMARYLLSSREAEVVRATDGELRAMNRAVIGATRKWIERETEAGALRALPTVLYYALLIGPAQEFARQWVRGGDRGAMDDALRHLPAAAWRAVRA
jgi:AcrR family transcriptional regulator